MTTIATLIKTEILSDVRSGRVPATVESFSDLHDYVDANEYLINAGVPWDVDPVTGETDLGPTNAVTDIVDAWLKDGGLIRTLVSVVRPADDDRRFITAWLSGVDTFQPDPTTEAYDRDGLAAAVNEILAEV